MLILTVAHICACGFMWITTIDPEKENWLLSSGLEKYIFLFKYYFLLNIYIIINSANWDKRYLYSVYFMVITMSTIGILIL